MYVLILNKIPDPMYPILLQAMMALPFGIVFVGVFVTGLLYTIFRLSDRISSGKRNKQDEKQRRQKRSVHMLIAIIGGIIAGIIFTCAIAFAPGPTIN